METVSRLFGSPAKIKLIKLFAFNPGLIMDLETLSIRTREPQSKVRQELSNLEKMRFLRRRRYLKFVGKKAKSASVKKKRVSGWVLNENFEFLVPLQQFLIKINHFNPKYLTKSLGKGGTIKLIILAGIFIQDPDSRVDILVVGDHLKKNVIENVIRNIEAETGMQLKYAVFDTIDFQYRLGLYDKLVRDILDFPHETILNKIGV